MEQKRVSVMLWEYYVRVVLHRYCYRQRRHCREYDKDDFTTAATAVLGRYETLSLVKPVS